MAKLIWITGLSGSGKTTIAQVLYKKLQTKYLNLVLLDGDAVREVFEKDLGFSEKDRIINALRIQNLCQLLLEQNIHVICATISMFESIYKSNRKKFENYFEIYIHCNLDVLKIRDKFNIYANAQESSTKNIEGINLNFDKPLDYDMYIDTSHNENVHSIVENILCKMDV